MINLEMNNDEAKFLLSVLDRYDMHLEVEIVKTHRREFKEALKERAQTLKMLIVRLKKDVKD